MGVSENSAVQFGSVVRDQRGILVVSEHESNMIKIAFEESHTGLERMTRGGQPEGPRPRWYQGSSRANDDPMSIKTFFS